jgi:hypothetical protein
MNAFKNFKKIILFTDILYTKESNNTTIKK